MSMKMMRQLQKQMEKVQEELRQTTVEATSGGGAVTVVVTGEQHVESIRIDPAAIDPEDPEFLADMITAAVNEGIEQSQDLAKQKLSGLTGGLNIPGLT